MIVQTKGSNSNIITSTTYTLDKYILVCGHACEYHALLTSIIYRYVNGLSQTVAGKKDDSSIICKFQDHMT